MKYLSLSFFALALVLSGAFAFAPQSAEASCSYNGYLHSGGKCDKSGKSGKWERKWHDDDDDDEDEDDDHGNRGYGYWHKPYVPYYGGNTDALQRYIDELIALIERLKSVQNGNSNSGGDIRVSTQSATDIDEDRAVLRALIDMQNEDEGELFFEYGTSYGNLSKDSDTVTLDEDDDGDTVEEEITGLDDDTRYYYRAVVEDEDGDKRYGAILSFITDDNGNNDNNDDVPEVSTLGAQNIDTDSADLRGEIDMNDYENGRAFFVYGEDESQIDDVEDEYDSYSDVDEDNDDLRKVEVDGDVDGTESYTKNVADLDGNTDIFFALCVEYDDDDTDETLVCGSTKNFETD